ncbi:MAG: efflux RND transporter permease subunit, partial [Candidatus Hydrogenedentota bacterium]
YTAGIMGKILRVFPIVVISVLGISLVEALLILPAHLSSKRSIGKNPITALTGMLSSFTERHLEHFVNGRFARAVTKAVKFRYVTLACGFAIFIITIGFIAGGYIKFIFFDTVEADNMIAALKMPQGTPFEQTREIAEKIERAALDVIAEFDAKRNGKPSLMKHMATTIGSQPTLARGGPGHTEMDAVVEAHLAEVNVELLGGEERDVSSVLLKNRWRDLVGEIPGVSSLTFISEFMTTGEPINVELSHENFDTLLKAAEDLKPILKGYDGVEDIEDSFEPGKTELKLSLKDKGRTLGLTLSDLARQVRQGFYGEEAQRIQRGRDDIRVMVRYPESERRSLANIEDMRIRLPDGTE